MLREYYILYYRAEKREFGRRRPAWFRCFAKNNDDAFEQFKADEERFERLNPEYHYVFCVMVVAQEVIKTPDLLE